MKTSEGNQLIAEFIGSDETQDLIDQAMDAMGRNFLIFDSDWNWLMTAVYFIEQMGFNFSIYTDVRETECSILKPTIANNGQIIFVRDESKIQCVWIAVVEFIQWYNSQKNV